MGKIKLTAVVEPRGYFLLKLFFDGFLSGIIVFLMDTLAINV